MTEEVQSLPDTLLQEIVDRGGVGSVIMSQISRGVLMRVGARNVTLVKNGVEFSVGPTTRRRVLITLNAFDLYDICVKSLRWSKETETDSSLVWEPEYDVVNIWNDQLDELLLFIERRVWGGEVE